MEIFKSDYRPAKRASSDWFASTVWQEPILEAPYSACVRVLSVLFEPDAKPYGILIRLYRRYDVNASSFVWLRNEPPKMIKAGGTVWIPPKKSTGAALDQNPLEHIAIQEALEGSVFN
jgi:hypothetical protein